MILAARRCPDPASSARHFWSRKLAVFGLLALAMLAGPLAAGKGGGPRTDPLEDLRIAGPGRDTSVSYERGIVDVFTRLNVRSGPGLDGAIVGKLYPGDPVRITDRQGDWYEIGWKGGRAWVHRTYVRKRGETFRNAVLARPDWTTEPPAAGRRRAPELPWWLRPPRIDERTPRRSLLRMPLYSQGRVGGRYPKGYCGPTSLKMAAEHFGIRKHVDELALSKVGPGTPMYRPGRGSTHQGLATMARHIGLRGTFLSYGQSLAWMQAQVGSGRPVIVGLRGRYAPGRNTQGHIAVVVGFTPRGDVVMNDPADGKQRVVPRRTFYQAWSTANGGRMAVVVSP